MNTELEFEVPTWDEIYAMLLSIAEKIRKMEFKPEIIVGVSRGGWLPARILSDLLDNCNLANVKVEFYTGVAETKRKPILTQHVSMPVTGKRVVIVDEVADTGESLTLVKEHVFEQSAKEVKTATVYCKPWSVMKPDFCQKETDHWVVFPWEAKETIRKLAGRCSKKGVPIEKEMVKLVKAGLSKRLAERFLKEILGEDKC